MPRNPSQDDTSLPVAIIGGGPAGSIAALCLRKLGREVIVFEKERFPRYRIGESLLPGTMSILQRLGVFERVAAAGFPKKRAATFLWGDSRPPWTFSFATPKTAPWVFDHAYQVNRAEYDQILLDAAAERGAEVRQGVEVSQLDLGDAANPAGLHWANGAKSGRASCAFVIDASGRRGVVAQQHGLRTYDAYFRNMAVWSYFRGGKRYQGDLEGNIFSVAFAAGWIWLIPLKDDIYSVGVVTGLESNAQIRERGAEAFYQDCLESSPQARELLRGAERCDEIRIVTDWSYESKAYSLGRAFLCGDSGCFIDPLFSQGVHLATYSAMLAASAIDFLYGHPEESEAVRRWYDRAYREAYSRYHQFVAAFYDCVERPGSEFWGRRKIAGAADERLLDKDWYAALSGDPGAAARQTETGAATLAALWRHSSNELSEETNTQELALRRVAWASRLIKQFHGMKQIRWNGSQPTLHPSYRVHPTTFRLESTTLLGDENGRVLSAFPLREEHRQILAGLRDAPLGFRELSKKLQAAKAPAPALQILGRLFEMGLLIGFDAEGKPVEVEGALRFGGVGSEDDLS